MNFFKRLFGKLPLPSQQSDVSDNCNYQDELEKLFIEKVIEMLKTNPEDFSARWFNGQSLDYSVRSQNTQILVMIDSGQICSPIKPIMTKGQKELVKQLLKPIVEKDRDYLIERLIRNNH